jgi:hypothetical protein
MFHHLLLLGCHPGGGVHPAGGAGQLGGGLKRRDLRGGSGACMGTYADEGVYAGCGLVGDANPRVGMKAGCCGGRCGCGCDGCHSVISGPLPGRSPRKAGRS